MIIKIIAVIALAVILFLYYYTQRQENRIIENQNDINKLTDQYLLINHWLEAKNFGKSVSDFCVLEGYRHIAIYGMADLANRLMDDLKDSEIIVDYGIDQDVSCSIARIENVYSLEESLPMVDAIIVTPIHAYSAIKTDLERKLSCPVISLEEVIWSI